MDRIYSRKRIKIPSVKTIYHKDKRAKKKMLVVAIILIAMLTFYNIYSSINPIFDKLCEEKASQIATKIINEQSSIVLGQINYSDIVLITKEENSNTNILKTDVAIINKIASEIAVKVQEELEKLKKENIQLPLGSVTGIKYLAGVGPNITINILPTGAVTTEIKNEFEAQGINQTAYRIYLELICSVDVVTQYKTITENIINQVLLVETVVVGDIPTTYFNLDNSELAK